MNESFPARDPERHSLSPEQAGEKFEAPRPHHEQAEKEGTRDKNDLETIRRSIERTAEPLATIEGQADKEKPAAPPQVRQQVSKDMKVASRNRLLKNIQRQLPFLERAFSKIIHAGAVKNVSAVSAATVTRPSGMLGGSICAFLGSLLFYWLSKRTGFTYNYLLFVVFFVGGFLIGLILELALFLVRHKKNPA